MSAAIIRAASLDEFRTAASWAADEGWNPGLDDLPAFFAADPNGFLMGFVDGMPVSSISVVRYGADYGFLGFYIVHPDYRGSGIGWKTWQAGIRHLAGRTIGLDGVVEQQDNYKKSGFVAAGRTIRFSGSLDLASGLPANANVTNIQPARFNAINALDYKIFCAERSAFMKQWLLPDLDAQRQSFALFDDGECSGFATLRKCITGYKIGPLFATDRASASALLRELSNHVDVGDQIIIDVPEANHEAVDMVEQLGLSPVFETARMYRGKAPNLSDENIYGVTTLELG